MSQYVEVVGKIVFDAKEDYLAYKKEVEPFLDTKVENCFKGSSKINFKEDILEVWFPIDSNLEELLNLDDTIVILEEKQMKFNKFKTKIRLYTEDGEFSIIEFSDGYVNRVYDCFKDFMNLFGYAKLKEIGISDDTIFAELIENYTFGGTPLEDLRELCYNWLESVSPKEKVKGRIR